MKWRLLRGDVRETLRELPDESVQCCVTSPPYYSLRDYQASGQIGLEESPEAYVAQLVAVFREVRRVLKPDGVLWLNLGDTLERKQLLGIPWRTAFALQADGWWLRSDIVWSKPSPMPESVTDRPTKAHEYIFLLAKSPRYYYDGEAIREENQNSGVWGAQGIHKYDQAAGQGLHGASSAFKAMSIEQRQRYLTGGRNCRSVWTITTQPYPEAHFATFPEELPERCIKAGSRIGDVVLDPFAGSGTTGKVALRLGREFIGCELNPEYVELARKRIGGAAPLFTKEQTA